MNLYCISTEVFIWRGNHGGSTGLNVFIQHVSPSTTSPSSPSSHVVSGWASASVMKDTHGEEFTGPPLFQTSFLLRRLCPCFLSHDRDFPLLSPSRRSCILITRGNSMKCQCDQIQFVLLFSSSISLKNTSLQKQVHPTSTTSLLPQAESLLVIFSHYLALFRTVMKQSQISYLRWDKAFMGTEDNSVNTEGGRVFHWNDGRLSEQTGGICFRSLFWENILKACSCLVI